MVLHALGQRAGLWLLPQLVQYLVSKVAYPQSNPITTRTQLVEAAGGMAVLLVEGSGPGAGVFPPRWICRAAA